MNRVPKLKTELEQGTKATASIMNMGEMSRSGLRNSKFGPNSDWSPSKSLNVSNQSWSECISMSGNMSRSKKSLKKANKKHYLSNNQTKLSFNFANSEKSFHGNSSMSKGKDEIGSENASRVSESKVE